MMTQAISALTHIGAAQFSKKFSSEVFALGQQNLSKQKLPLPEQFSYLRTREVPQLGTSAGFSLPKLWDLKGLRQLLSFALSGDQVIVVSNRQPYAHERVNQQVRVSQPASGLITALEPVVRACGGTWIAHGSGNADRDFVDENDVWQVPSGKTPYRLKRVWMNAEEQAGYYDGFSNSGLWPLCHMTYVPPVFQQADWQQYQVINQRFADAVVKEARRPDPIVLVQDYHLALVPALVRSRLPRATIVTFWHIPWGHPEQMNICPWLPELIEGLLGSDIVGFQTKQYQDNFIACAQACGKQVNTHDPQEFVEATHRVRVQDYPISIAWPDAEDPPAAKEGKEEAALFAAFKCQPLGQTHKDEKIILGVDRFDYTKGLLERFHAVDQLLEQHPQWRGRVRLVQVAAPTRITLPAYANFREQVFALVKEINQRWQQNGWEPICLLDRHHNHEQLKRWYRRAQICLVTSLQDGMNLVCKEFIAARQDEQGVLVLSQFAGAAQELNSALIVNPYHLSQVVQALHRGLAMSPQEQQRRMRALRDTVKQRNVYRWAADMLMDVAVLRTLKRQAKAFKPKLALLSS